MPERSRIQHGGLAVSLGLTVFAATGCTQNSPGPIPDAPFAERLESALAAISERDLPVIVGVSHQGGPTEVHEYGALADDPLAPDVTQIDIGSITKTVTGVAAARLAEQGLVRFDETLADVFDDVPQDKAGITLHQLLTHSSGLVGAVGSDEEVLERDVFVQRALASDLRSAPGERYNYSNTGYGLVGAIIEIRSGRTYDDYLREEVLSDPGFENTGYDLALYDDDRSMRSPDNASILTASWGGHQASWNLIGNGGMLSTVPEMIAFRRAVIEGRILGPDMLAIVQTPHQKEGAFAGSHYGYGLVVETSDPVGQIYWHDGGNDVFSAQWGHYPDQGDILFTAGADDRNGDAFEAMEILEEHLYGR